MLELKSVEALPDYRLKVTYTDGVEGEIDVSHLVGRGVFQELADPATFARVGIGTGGEITWGGQADLCPDAVYLRVTGKKPEDIFPNLATTAAHA